MVSNGMQSGIRDKVKLCALGVLMGCGSGPAPLPTPPPPVVRHHVGGAPVAGCLAALDGDALVVVAFAGHVELWRLADPPVLTVRLPLGDVPGPAVDHLDCTDGLRIGRGARRWRIDPATAQLIASGDGAAGMPALPMTGTLADDQQVRLTASTLTISAGETRRWWRAFSGPLRAAVWDGQAVWAVGNGLWRWRPGPGQPTAIPLPPEWQGRALGDVFRDGGLLWLTDTDGRGAAFDVRAPLPTQIGDAGQMPAPEPERRVVVGGRRFEGKIGASALQIDGADVALPAPLDSMTALGDGALVAAGDTLVFWGGDAGTEVWRVPLPGRTVAIFPLDDGRVLLVGRRYGFMVLRAG